MRYVFRIVATLIFIFPLQALANNEAVKCAQQFLNYKGYNAGPADGLIGKKTRLAAENLATDQNLALPNLNKQSAKEWCDYAAGDSVYVAFKNFEYEPNGIIAHDVAFDVSRQSAEAKKRACGAASKYKIALLERVEPIKEIKGFNSRKDNLHSVPNGRESEEFVGDFASQVVAASASDDSENLSRLIRLLAKWAKADAFLDTVSCVQSDGYIRSDPPCTEWTQDDGHDLSGAKDSQHVMFLLAALSRNYYAFLQDHEPEALRAEHAAISTWLGDKFAKRLPTPRKVYFGNNMAYYWPAIILDINSGKTKKAHSKLKKLAAGISKEMRSDGSIKDRTTRGDRALWYHFTSIGEVVMSFELMRASGMVPDPADEDKLHSAVDLFIRAVEDFSAIHPWASKRHNSSYDGETQDWNKYGWQDSDFGGSWLHVYPYRYPNHPNSAWLMSEVDWNARSATKDNDFGIGVGCIYNLAGGRVTQ